LAVLSEESVLAKAFTGDAGTLRGTQRIFARGRWDVTNFSGKGIGTSTYTVVTLAMATAVILASSERAPRTRPAFFTFTSEITSTSTMIRAGAIAVTDTLFAIFASVFRIAYHFITKVSVPSIMAVASWSTRKMV